MGLEEGQGPRIHSHTWVLALHLDPLWVHPLLLTSFERNTLLFTGSEQIVRLHLFFWWLCGFTLCDWACGNICTGSEGHSPETIFCSWQQGYNNSGCSSFLVGKQAEEGWCAIMWPWHGTLLLSHFGHQCWLEGCQFHLKIMDLIHTDKCKTWCDSHQVVTNLWWLS